MTANEIIKLSRQLNSNDLLTELMETFAFKPNESKQDLNLGMRTEIVEELLSDFSIIDITLIRALFHEELKCELATWQSVNLYQLCFYLFHLGQIEDTFLLYDAKFNAKNMDVGMMLDREMITVRHDIDEVIEFVENTFNNNPEMKEKFSGLVEKLLDLKKCPQYVGNELYHLFIRGYFYGHDNVR